MQKPYRWMNALCFSVAIPRAITTLHKAKRGYENSIRRIERMSNNRKEQCIKNNSIPPMHRAYLYSFRRGFEDPMQNSRLPHTKIIHSSDRSAVHRWKIKNTMTSGLILLVDTPKIPGPNIQQEEGAIRTETEYLQYYSMYTGTGRRWRFGDAPPPIEPSHRSCSPPLPTPTIHQNTIPKRKTNLVATRGIAREICWAATPIIVVGDNIQQQQYRRIIVGVCVVVRGGKHSLHRWRTEIKQCYNLHSVWTSFFFTALFVGVEDTAQRGGWARWWTDQRFVREHQSPSFTPPFPTKSYRWNRHIEVQYRVTFWTWSTI